MDRVVAYIDGYNLYYGLKEAKFKRFLWLDVCRLVHSLATPDQRIVKTKYFTTRVPGPKETRARQLTFLRALETLDGLDIVYGRFQDKKRRCNACHATWKVPEEKKTDVNIAVEMMRDAAEGVFDVAMLISADSDLTPPIDAIRSVYPQKRVVVAFPPERSSIDLRKCADHCFQIGRATLARSQLPETLESAPGLLLTRPPTWK